VAVRIDVHAHCWPDAYLDLLAEYGTPRTEVARSMRAGDDRRDMAARLAEMDRLGVDRQIVSVLSLAPHFVDADRAVAAAMIANDLLAFAVNRHPDRLAAFGVLPLPHVDYALKETSRALDELGMAGIAVTTTVLGRSLADPTFIPLFAELDERSAILFVHPAGTGCGPHIDEHGLAWPVGAVFEDTFAAIHLLRAGILERFPRIEIVLCHLGGALPMLMGRLAEQFGADEVDQLKRLWFDSAARGHVPALRCAVDTFGADRILLGTDYPFTAGDPFDDLVVANMVDRNADRLFWGEHA
jgi:aminocarboxymuconate-semialdehyde decarboxylase